MNIQKVARQYFDRFSDFSFSIQINSEKTYRTIIVIPCFKEPEILLTLKSLRDCDTPKYPTLVLILVNASETAENSIKSFNQNTHSQVLEFIGSTSIQNLDFQCFLDNELPKKHAGVGYARKSLMDTALQIFSKQETEGIIVNTDADCLFSSNYIIAIEDTFENSKIQFAVNHYKHRIEEEKNPILAKAITEYELHLRYYKQALQWTGYPNVLETIGSCMICLASIYAKEGGMNKRKAGEDFYFINKLSKNHLSTTITSSAVLPSCRPSDRVPFGTGKAMNDYIDDSTEILTSYDLECFSRLKSLIENIDIVYLKGMEDFNANIPPIVWEFLKKNQFEDKVKPILKQSNSLSRFRYNFFSWFDHLKALQLIHYITEHKFAKLGINKVAKRFLEELNEDHELQSSYDLLLYFREREITLN